MSPRGGNFWILESKSLDWPMLPLVGTSYLVGAIAGSLLSVTAGGCKKHLVFKSQPRRLPQQDICLGHAGWENEHSDQSRQPLVCLV